MLAPINRLPQSRREQRMRLETKMRLGPQDVEFTPWLTVGLAGIPHDLAREAGKAAIVSVRSLILRHVSIQLDSSAI